jgi:hypothetical protein
VKVWRRWKKVYHPVGSRKQAKHTLTHEFICRIAWNSLYTPMVIEKSELWCTFKGNCWCWFFAIGVDKLYQESDSVLFSEDITNQEVEEVKRISLWTLGNIIHETLKSLWSFVEIYLIRHSKLQANQHESYETVQSGFLKKRKKKGRKFTPF